MKKFTKIIAAATAALLALSIAGCDKNSAGGNYPPFKNPTDQTDVDETSEKYIVNVVSEGGFKLDGVQVSAVRDGTVIRRGISIEGKIEFGISLGEYDLVIDGSTLPAGYYLPEGVSYKTNPSRRDTVTIKVPSKVLPSGSSQISTYALGSIMRDFSFTDCNDRKYVLSDLLKTRKAVVLNFFFTTCGPCQAEFPSIQKAYERRPTNDLEIIAISSTQNGDSNSLVADFARTRGLTFPMGMDPVGLTSAFQIKGFPTTIVIDRYGMIAYRSSGTEVDLSFWTGLFNDFTASNYVQNIVVGDKPGGDDGNTPGGDRERPDCSMPASALMEAAANGTESDGTPLNSTFTPEKDEFSWPWLIGSDDGGSYIYSSNKGKNSSYAIVHSQFDMKAGDVLSLEYSVSSEAGADKLHILLDGELMNENGWSGDSNGWQSVDLYVADRDKTVDLAFAYRKDQRDPEYGVGDDVAKIRNIHLADNSVIENALDVMRVCADGEVTADNKYSHYITPVLGDDGFYHKDTKDGALIYMTLTQLTPWSDLHTGNNTMGENGTTYLSTLFNMTANQFYDDNTCVIGGVDITETYRKYVLIQGYMPAPYYLIPVSEDLKGWADAFIANYEKGTQHENEWLEFCFYYDHYGNAHTGTETCKVDEDYTHGLMTNNSYTAYEKTDLENHKNGVNVIEGLDPDSYNATTGRNVARINFPLQLAHNGSYYKFTATRKGVYQLRSYTKGCSPDVTSTEDNAKEYVTPVPGLTIYDENGEYVSIAGEPRDADSLTTENYEGFNHYITLDAGETVYLYLETASGQRTYYDFEITYRGEKYEKMFFCTTDGGAWTWYDDESGNRIFTYLGIPVKYDENTDCYYAADKDGNILYEQPVYIDMIHASFLINTVSKYNYASLQKMINDNAFRDYILGGEIYQPVMKLYLGQATEGDETDPMYGLVKANREIVDIINMYINENVDGLGDGRGWLAFAIYKEIMG